MKGGNIHKVGEQIKKFVEMLEHGRRRSIQQHKRFAIDSIKSINFYKLLEIEWGNKKAKIDSKE